MYRMKFNFNIKYFVSGCLIVLLLNYSTFLWTTEVTQNNTPRSTNLKIELWDIQNSIEVVWDAELVDEQSLSFNQAGTIVSVNFQAGDSVKKWEVIAQIDNSDAYDSIAEAKISLENAQISMRQLYEEIDQSKILQAKNSITSAENNLSNALVENDNLKVSQENSLSKLLNDIETSEKEVELLIKQQENSLEKTDISKSATVVNIEDDFKVNLLDISETIETMDYIMWVSSKNKDKNDDYEDYLWAADRTTRSEAKTQLILLINQQEWVQKNINFYNYSGEKQGILNILDDLLVVYNTIYDTSDLIYDTAENSIISAWAFSQSDIDSIKNSMSSYKSSALNQMSSLKSSINTLNTLTDTELLWDSNSITIQKQTKSIENAINNYNEIVANYALTTKSKQQDIQSKEVSLDVVKLSLEELLEGPTDDNITKANNSIQQANIKLESAYGNLEDYTLTAPFDGVIRKIDYRTGDNLTNDASKYIYIENPNLLEVNVMLDQIDIITVALWQDAIITFDAYSTIPVKAKISSIDTTPVQSSWVISYEVKLVLDDPDFTEKTLSWMTANVEIIIESKNDILIIKTNAITETAWRKYLNIIKNWEQTKTEIETWISSNGMTEVISWASLWDIIFTKEFVSTTTEKAAATTLFPTANTTWRWNRIQ